MIYTEWHLVHLLRASKLYQEISDFLRFLYEDSFPQNLKDQYDSREEYDEKLAIIPFI